MANQLNVDSIAKQIQDEVTDKMSLFFKAEVNARAKTAARRTKVIRSHGHRYTYSKYQNTGQLAANIKVIKNGSGKSVTDGSRANYSDGSYHGLYFLVTKKGQSDVKSVLRKGKKYAETLKL